MKDLVNQTQDIVNLSVKLAEPSKVSNNDGFPFGLLCGTVLSNFIAHNHSELEK